MFHWICPECGREIAPAVKECPSCEGSATAAASGVAKDNVRAEADRTPQSPAEEPQVIAEPSPLQTPAEAITPEVVNASSAPPAGLKASGVDPKSEVPVLDAEFTATAAKSAVPADLADGPKNSSAAPELPLEGVPTEPERPMVPAAELVEPLVGKRSEKIETPAPVAALLSNSVPSIAQPVPFQTESIADALPSFDAEAFVTSRSLLSEALEAFGAASPATEATPAMEVAVQKEVVVEEKEKAHLIL